VGIDEVNKFNILNIELSIPINYYHKSFIFSFIPHLAFPQSSATITTEDAVIKKTLRKYFTGQQELVIGLIEKRKTMTRINHYLL
jgi:hypothetical protein